MIKIVAEKIKKNWQFILAGFLWLCIWATYNTDIFRLFVPGFPQNKLDLIHGFRSLLPLLAIIFAVFILVRNKKFNFSLIKGPLGLLLLYSIIGIIASLLSYNPVMSFYWGILYLSAIVVLLAVATGSKAVEKISFIARINWIIAGLISMGMIFALFANPGVFSFSTVTQFLEGGRPFETIGKIGAEKNFLDMPGTRATGLGRYAGIVAIALFANLWRPRVKNKFIFGFLFTAFLSVLIFSRARTSVIAFLVATLTIFWLKSKSKASFIFVTGSICLLLLPVNFYQFSLAYLKGEDLLPESNQIVSTISTNKPVSNLVVSGVDKPVSNTVSPSIVNVIGSTAKNIPLTNKVLFTLSGRTNGVWTDAWHLFLSSPLIGKGFDADRIFLNRQHTHNSFLQALIQSGIIGTLFFIFAIILACVISVRFLKVFPENIVLIEVTGVLVFLIIRSITESSAFFSADYLFLAPAIAYLQVLSQKKISAEKKGTAFKFSGNKINAITIKDTVDTMANWIKNERHKKHWVIVTGMHGIVEAEKHADFKYMISNADLFVPDGISLVWLANLKGIGLKKRVSGADLMKEFFKTANEKGFSSYFYGDTEDTLKELDKRLSDEFNHLKIAGSYSPPFRQLTEKEDEEIIEKINRASPDVLWVGLGLPKQEKWIFEHKEKLNVPVIIGVGAAFKFLSKKVKRAPLWVGSAGFEWLWRLVFEPKTTWKRVIIDIPIFFWLVIKDLLTP